MGTRAAHSTTNPSGESSIPPAPSETMADPAPRSWPRRAAVPTWQEFVHRTRRNAPPSELFRLENATLLWAADQRGSSGPLNLGRISGPGRLIVSFAVDGAGSVELAVRDKGRRIFRVSGNGGSGSEAFPKGIADGILDVAAHGATQFVVIAFWSPGL